MNRSVLFAMLPVLFAPGAFAQYWDDLDGGITGAGSIYVAYGDSIWDALLLGTSVKYIIRGNDSLVSSGAVMWDGATWSGMPTPIDQCDDGTICNGVFRFIRYRGVLYINGYIGVYSTDSIYSWNFARWNANVLNWEPLSCINPDNGGMLYMAGPSDDTLYLTGYRGSICGYPESCVFAYDGDSIYPFAPFDDWTGESGDYVGLVFKFQAQYYMTGLLNDAGSNAYYGLLRYNGLTWEPVPGFTTSAPFKDVLIHEDKLYLCGFFFTETGAPGNMIASFDGDQWSDMGGGLRYAPNSTEGLAKDLYELNGDIYVAGKFYYAGGVPAENVARWNGHQWCGLGGQFATQFAGGQVSSITSWRDTIYIAGDFVTIDGDTMHNVAKWLGEVENCSPSVGVTEASDIDRELVPVQLDVSGTWSVALPIDAQEVLVFDAFGRVVQRPVFSRQGNTVFDLRNEAIGVYFLSCRTASGTAYRTKVFKL